MKQDELEQLAERHQKKADRAFQNYQETGTQRFAREYRQNEDLAEALRMAARAAADSERLTDLRVTLSEFGYRAAQLLDHGTQDHMTALLKDFAAAARIRGLIN